MCVYMYTCIQLYTDNYNSIYHLYIKMKDMRVVILFLVKYHTPC